MVKLNKFHRKNIERMLKKVNCPIDIIDINAIWDSSLSAEENFNRIKEELKKLGYVNVEDYYQKDEKEYLEHKMTLEEEKHYRKEFEKRISQIKKSNIRELSEYYKNYYEHIESFLKNKKTNGFICVGEAGIGKCVALFENDFIVSGDGNLINNPKVSEVFTLNNDLKIEKCKVKNHFQREVNELIKIRLSSGKQIFLTPEHLVLTIKGWKMAKELKPKSSFIATVRRYPNLKNTNTLAPCEIELLGFLLAEGHLDNNLSFTQKVSKEIIKRFKKDIYEKFGDTIKIVEARKKHSYLIRNKSGRKRNPVKTWLRKMGLWGVRSETKFIPKEILTLNNDLLSIFLRALFSCDASFYKRTLEYVSKSEKMIRQVQHLLLRFGILSNLKKREITWTWKGKKKKLVYWRLVVTDRRSLESFYKNIGFIQKTKQRKLKKCVEKKVKIQTNKDIIPFNWKHPSRIWLEKNIELLNKLANSDIFWDRVLEVNLIKGKFTVYDLEVEKNHNFIVNDIIIHNSFNLMLKLKEKQLDFKLIKGHFTPLAFYKFLYENREKSYIIIDDITKLANDKDIISLLLGALDYDNRLVEWESSRPLTADLPRNFIFNSKIFILANQFDETNEFLKALKDRCVYYELRFSREQIIEMLYILAKKRNYPLELVDYIKELSENEIIKNLSLRILDKIYPYYSRPNWKELVREIMETDEMLSLVYQIIKETKIVKEQVRRFIEETGMSRRTFFRYKKKLKLALRGLK